MSSMIRIDAVPNVARGRGPKFGGLRLGRISAVVLVACFGSPVAVAMATSTPAYAASAPGMPTDVTVTPEPESASVSFVAPTDDGGSPITGYTAVCTSNTGLVIESATAAASPITVDSLPPTDLYTCSVNATNGIGSSGPSSLSNPFATDFGAVADSPHGISADGVHTWALNAGDCGVRECLNGTVNEIDDSNGAVIQTISVGLEPDSISSDGTNVWVANSRQVFESGPGSVTEISAATGAVIQTINLSFLPNAISSDGFDVWVVGRECDSTCQGTVTELSAATGALIQTISVTGNPTAVDSDGTDVWVTSQICNQECNQPGIVTEIAAATGAVIETIGVGINPDSVSSDGINVWVANWGACAPCQGSVTELSASTGDVLQTTPVGENALDISSDGVDVWVTNANSGSFTEFDASTRAVVQTIDLPSGSEPDSISSDGTDVWESGDGPSGGVVTEFSASTGDVVQAVGDFRPDAIASDGSHVWVGSSDANSVTELDASSGAVIQTIGLEGAPTAVDSDGTDVWVTSQICNPECNQPGIVTEIAAATGAVIQTIGVGINPDSVSSDGTNVWVANEGACSPCQGSVTELSASTGDVLQTTPVGEDPEGISSDGVDVWVTNINSDSVTELDASTGAVVQTIDLPSGSEPYSISSDGAHVWVSNWSNGTVIELAASTGAIVQTIGGFGGDPLYVTSDRTDVWVTVRDHDNDDVNGWVTELSASTGSEIQTIGVGGYLDDAATDGTTTWVTNESDSSVLGINAASGAYFDSVPLDYSPPPSIETTSLPDATAVQNNSNRILPTSASARSSRVQTSLTQGAQTSYNQALAATGGVGALTWSINSGTLPTGLTLDPATGTISGTVGSSATTETFGVTATDADDVPSAPQILTIAIDGTQAVPAFTSAATATFTVGSAGTLNVTATGTPTFAETGALDGLTLSSTGVLSGTPTIAGTFPVVITATNAAGSATQDFALRVNIPAVPAFTSAATATFTVGSAGTFKVRASGVPAPTFAETGALDGLTLSSTGVLSGTPTIAGTFPVVITATNAAGSATRDFTLTVVAPALKITTTSLPTGRVGAAYSATLVADGGTTPYTWKLARGWTLPKGLALSKAGVISGTPATKSGTTTFKVKVTDVATSTSPAVTVVATLRITIHGRGHTA